LVVASGCSAAGNDAGERGQLSERAAGDVAERGGVFCPETGAAPLAAGIQLNNQLAAEADVFLRDFDRVPGQAPALALLSP
jgi:hypothetical protein